MKNEKRKMEMKKVLGAGVILLCFWSTASAQVPPDRDGLLNGEGMGQAKYAEMNGYPGPKHVLELAAELNLNERQKESVQKIYDVMRAQALSIGKLIVHEEERLHAAFGNKQVSQDTVDAISDRVGRLRGRLRAVHLVAHLGAKMILGREQIETYKTLRGVGGEHHDMMQKHTQ